MVTSTNGTAVENIPAATATKETATVKILPAGGKAKDKNTEKTENAATPLSDRLHRLNQLFDLQRKYNALQISLKNLEDFELKKGDEEGSYITIRDDNRNEFTTRNTAVIKVITATLKKTFQEKIKELEPLLTW